MGFNFVRNMEWTLAAACATVIGKPAVVWDEWINCLLDDGGDDALEAAAKAAPVALISMRSYVRRNLKQPMNRLTVIWASISRTDIETGDFLRIANCFLSIGKVGESFSTLAHVWATTRKFVLLLCQFYYVLFIRLSICL